MLRAGVLAAGSGALRITVIGAASKNPLALARGEIYGPRALEGTSGVDGAMTFEDLPPGVYEIVVSKSGYVPQTLRNITVTGSQTSNIAVHLQRAPRQIPSWVRTLAIVRVKPKPKSSTTQTTSDSPAAILSNSMVNALRTLPSIVLRGSGFAQYPSIGGHPANQTAVSIAGVPVSAFGGVPNVFPFNLDLFSSVSIDQNSAYGSPGGTINFELPAPTLDWFGIAKGVEGAFGNQGVTLTEKGTSGRLGVSFTHAARDEGNPLDGMRFLDSSGLIYVHDALARTSGDALNMRYPFSLNNVLYGSIIGIRSHVPMFCAVFTGPTPCGYGPLNKQDNALTSGQLRELIASGRVSASLSIFHNRNTLDVNQNGRYVNGVNFPQFSTSTTVANGFILDGQVQIGRGYPVNFNLTNNNQTTSSAGNAFGTIVQPVLSNLAYTNASILGPLFSRQHLSSDVKFGFQRQSAESRPNAQISLSYKPTSDDTLTLQYGSGFLVSPTASFAGIADPPSLQFNCDARNALGLGPSTPGNNSSSAKTALSWNHEGNKISTAISLHHEVDLNSSVGALVSASGFNPALFTPAYLASVQQNYRATCGANAVPIALGDVYYEVTAPVPHVTYDGGEINVHISPSRTVVADVSYGMMLAHASGGGGLIFSPASTVIAGAQLPNQPMHTANLSIATAIGRTGATALANIHYVSTNNPNNLPAYTTVDAGLELPLLNNGKFIVSLLNLTSTQAGVFATTHGAVPLLTPTGNFATVATPLLSQSLNVAFHFPVGTGAQPAVPDLEGPETYGYKLQPYPNEPPSNPFAIDRHSGRCGPEAVASAEHYLGIVRDYVRRIEAVRVQSGDYPATFPSESNDGLQLYYRHNGSSYAVLITLDKILPADQRLPILKPLLGCTRFYSGFLPETRQRDLYISPYDEEHDLAPLADFTPAVGFYVPPSLVENEALFPSYVDVPKAPPADPFILSNAPSCSANVRAGAQAVVALLRPYVAAVYDRHERPEVPDGFQITPHIAPGGTWLEISSNDLDVKLLSQCLTIAGVGTSTLQKLGLDGTGSPSLDYAPQLGFYNEW